MVRLTNPINGRRIGFLKELLIHAKRRYGYTRRVQMMQMSQLRLGEFRHGKKMSTFFDHPVQSMALSSTINRSIQLRETIKTDIVNGRHARMALVPSRRRKKRNAGGRKKGDVRLVRNQFRVQTDPHPAANRPGQNSALPVFWKLRPHFMERRLRVQKNPLRRGCLFHHRRQKTKRVFPRPRANLLICRHGVNRKTHRRKTNL